MSSALFVCVGSKEHGMGHVTRDIVLAHALAARGVHVEFLTVVGTPGAAWLANTEYRVWLETDEQRLARVFRDGWHDAVILDLEQGPSLKLLQTARACFPHVINIGCIGFYPSEDMAAVDALTDLQVFGVELFDPPRTPHELAGPEYLLIDPAYAEVSPSFAGHVLVTFGGADPHNLSPIAALALADLGRRVKVVIGPAATVDVAHVERMAQSVQVIRSPASLIPLFHGAALCVTATGTTAYESLAAGVPALATNWSTDHLRTAGELAKRGVAGNLGLWSDFSESQLSAAVQSILNDAEWWHKASYGGRRLVDGQGAGRVGDAICKLIQAP
jgi:spore coat polysaccharide biosynthesis predicted glycosyltransferase SpsG